MHRFRGSASLVTPIVTLALLTAVSHAGAQVVSSLKDINPGDDTSFASGLTVFNGAIYFQATDGVSGIELWKTDGTAAGTQMVLDLNVGAPNGFPTGLRAANGSLWFAGYDTSPTTGQQVYRSDGTAVGTVLVSDTLPGVATGGFFGPPAPGGFTSLNSTTTVFTSISAAGGQELYATNGTPAGTYLIKDIHPGITDSIPVGMTELNGVVLFGADDSVIVDSDGRATFDRELWRTDGTAAGTFRVKDLNPGPGGSAPSSFAKFGNAVYFIASDDSGAQQLQRTDGTEAGTLRVSTLTSGFVNEIFPVGNKLYFTADDSVRGLELYTTDGTQAGTRLVKDINLTSSGDPGTTDSGNPFELVGFAGRAIFSADDGVHGSELWITDGTEDGTRLLADLNAGELRSGPTSFTQVGDVLFFVSILPDDENFTVQSQLWMLDANLNLTLVLTEAGDSFGYAFTDLTALGNTLIFNAPSGVDADGFSINTELHTVVVPEPALAAIALPATVLLRRRR